MRKIVLVLSTLLFIANCHRKQDDGKVIVPPIDPQKDCQFVQDSMPPIKGKNMSEFTKKVIETASGFENLKLRETAYCLDKKFSIICDTESCRAERK